MTKAIPGTYTVANTTVREISDDPFSIDGENIVIVNDGCEAEININGTPMVLTYDSQKGAFVGNGYTLNLTYSLRGHAPDSGTPPAESDDTTETFTATYQPN